MNRPALFLIIVVVLLALAGTGAWYLFFRTPAAPTPTTEIPVAEEVATIDESGAYYDIDATYPARVTLAASAGAEAERAAAATIERFVKEEAATFKRENIDTLRPEDIDFLELGQDRKYALGIDYDAYRGPNTVSYVFLIYADTMGAHPNAYYRTFTFDASTGAELELGDLFSPGTPYLEHFSAVSRERLIPLIAEKTQTDESDVDRDYVESGTTPRAENFQWFYLSGDTLTLIFPPYQVGPYVLGVQEVPVPLSELNGLNKAYR